MSSKELNSPSGRCFIAAQAGVDGVRVDAVIMLEVVTDALMLRVEELLEGHRKVLPSAPPPSFSLFSFGLVEPKAARR